MHAIVQLTPTASVDGADLRTYARQRLAPYKVPKGIQIVDALPSTLAGKINRLAVAAAYAEVPGCACRGLSRQVRKEGLDRPTVDLQRRVPRQCLHEREGHGDHVRRQAFAQIRAQRTVDLGCVGRAAGSPP